MVGGWDQSPVAVFVHSERADFIELVQNTCRINGIEDVIRYRQAEDLREDGFDRRVGCHVIDLLGEDADAIQSAVTEDIEHIDTAVVVLREERLDVAAGLLDRSGTFPVSTTDHLPREQLLGPAIARAIEHAQCHDELERYRIIAETVPDGVYILDHEFVYRYVNESFARILGYDPDELIGAHLSKINDETAIKSSNAARRRALERDDPIETTYNDHISADGERIPCEVQFRAIVDDGGELLGTVGILRDITERIERERELERHNERLRDFSRIVSHDIRSPLTVAQGNLELARETGETKRYLSKAEEALDRLEAIVEDLLTLAREGSAIEDPEPIDIGRVAEEATLVVDTTNATVDIAVDGATVRGEANRLRRLFENLYRNAIVHGGPDVTIHVGILEDGFYVEDNGPGIPEADRERVFESGYTTNEDGSGFGLNIVEEIAASHGMAVRVTTGELGGARFEITRDIPTTARH